MLTNERSDFFHKRQDLLDGRDPALHVPIAQVREVPPH